jgi:hypothetical protein
MGADGPAAPEMIGSDTGGIFSCGLDDPVPGEFD